MQSESTLQGSRLSKYLKPFIFISRLEVVFFFREKSVTEYEVFRDKINSRICAESGTLKYIRCLVSGHENVNAKLLMKPINPFYSKYITHRQVLKTI